VGSATAVAKAGAAIYSGGLSIVGESLLSAATRGGPGPCRTALGQGKVAHDPVGQPSRSSNPASQPTIEKALQGIFGR
jgi:hypothetical protein